MGMLEGVRWMLLQEHSWGQNSEKDMERTHYLPGINWVVSFNVETNSRPGQKKKTKSKHGKKGGRGGRNTEMGRPNLVLRQECWRKHGWTLSWGPPWCYDLGPILFFFRTASLLHHLHYLIPSAYYLLITSSLELFISPGQLYLVWTIYASY